MKNYSKNSANKHKIVKALIILCAVIFIVSMTSIVYVYIGNYFRYEKVDNAAAFVSDDVAKNATPIIVNNVVVGANYGATWVDSVRYTNKSTKKQDYEIDMFSDKGKIGSAKISEFKLSKEASTSYINTTRGVYINEYFAIGSGTASNVDFYKIEVQDETKALFEQYVKKALGIYGLLNNSVMIKEVYKTGAQDYMIAATSTKKTDGAYSCIIYVDAEETCHLVKYNYVKNVKEASKFGIFSIKFVADLNGDNISDIIIQETKEFDTIYSVIDKKDGKFLEVLSATIKN